MLGRLFALCLFSCSLFAISLDVQDRQVLEQKSPRTLERMDQGEPLTINDVIQLSQAGVSDDLIIAYMQETSSLYSLSPAQIKRLQNGGTSQRVINYMVDSGR
jgi:hypothetical protein